ncbi:glycosyltransferase [Vibrio sp. 10N.261.46.E12]|uniref:glycosyltransferase n=1 Tax=unclassified Vibrio TaxID=2614977 RepID=UPI000978C24D|nr:MULTISPECIES: glycosyltransferase [unclassified Vibrio]OMO37340.1 glycosyl transferase [Vibrio sp. 10N.261.45.E1]PMJ21957.1 glycosyl transferase [Vibrio sp. 10N.286.45.B6]PML90597.1 glycosyl transferase [Vibrio sp. 10N.261.49.E11]PMM72090.1 glycosyl transferase [Vibrio sp. 10N.261.46.F12]PMM80649.1 glycosyl transferase [Vibrio sp. 10N.261.46.E8]
MNTHLTKHGKKIIHVVQHLAPGGLETLTLDLLRLAKPSDQVLIVSLEGTKQESVNNWPKLEPYKEQIVFLDKAPGVQFNIIIKLIKAFNAIRPDVVHTHHIGPLLYAGYAARVTGVPTRIHTEHDAWHLNNNKRRRIQALALKAAQPTLVADATRVYNQLRAAFSYQNIITIKNGVDCEKFKPMSKEHAREALNLPTDKHIIGCAGRLEYVKGQDQLIKAMTLLPENMVVAFAGGGTKRAQLEQLTRRLNLSDRIIFLGLVEDMTTFYGALDTFCLPSRHEGLPLSTLEAQACNIPTVAMDVGAVDETLCPVSGTLVKKGSITGLANALLENQNERFLSPRRYVLENFDIIKMVSSYNDISEGAYA